MEFAEDFAVPIEGELGDNLARLNDLNETFSLRWGRIRFNVAWGPEVNLKVLLRVYRSDGTREQFLSDADAHEIQWNSHKRVTRDFYIQPFSSKLGRVVCVKCAYIVHYRGRSIPSQYEYIFMDGAELDANGRQHRTITRESATPNRYRTKELDAGLLQRDVDYHNSHFESLQLVPKFTKGTPQHPYHPKPYIHRQIDDVIRRKQEHPDTSQTIKVCVDCIDDTDFTDHLIHASRRGVEVQCVVDWRKMALTNSENYVRLKRRRLN